MTPKQWYSQQINNSGMSPSEASAQWANVDKALAPAGGPQGGFGLGGPTGCGKTYALAAWMKRLLREQAEARKPRGPNPMTFNDPYEPNEFLWVAWPEAIGQLRGHGALEWSETWVRNLCEIPYLVLDDLGAERIKGNYAEDWAASFLDRIVDRRYRFERPIWWTTNLDASALIGIYGARLVSRLMGPNPLIPMPPSPDRRFLKAQP